MKNQRSNAFGVVFFALVGLIGLSLGCDPGWELSGEVAVPADEQERFDDYPAQIVVHTVKTADLDDNGVNPTEETFRVGVLCEPSSDAARFAWDRSALGCAVRAEVTAWMMNLPLEDDQTCEEAREAQKEYADVSAYTKIDTDSPPDGAPRASTFAFPDYGETDCSGDSDHVELTLSTEN